MQGRVAHAGADLSRALARNYPPDLRDAGVHGEVSLRFRVLEDGRVDLTNVRVTRTTDLFLVRGRMTSMSAMRNVSAPAALLLAFACWACATGRAGDACPPNAGQVSRPQGEGWYHGPIVQIDSGGGQPNGGGARQLLVQVQPAGAWSGRIWFGVNESTALICRSGAPLSHSAPLAPGMTVSAKARMIMESDPGQAFADTLIVDPAP
jgi:hypothetical protein